MQLSRPRQHRSHPPYIRRRSSGLSSRLNYRLAGSSPSVTCVHEGEENGEITLDMALSDSSPSDAIARLQTARNIDAGPSEPFELGILSGSKFTATRTGNGEVMFQDSGYRTEAVGLPLEIYVVTATGQTVTIFIDPHESSGTAAQDFAEIALAIVKTIHFSG